MNIQNNGKKRKDNGLKIYKQLKVCYQLNFFFYYYYFDIESDIYEEIVELDGLFNFLLSEARIK